MKWGIHLSAVGQGSHDPLGHGCSAAQPLAQADALRHRDGDPTPSDIKVGTNALIIADRCAEAIASDRDNLQNLG